MGLVLRPRCHCTTRHDHYFWAVPCHARAQDTLTEHDPPNGLVGLGWPRQHAGPYHDMLMGVLGLGPAQFTPLNSILTIGAML